jgi:hypothetical protein
MGGDRYSTPTKHNHIGNYKTPAIYADGFLLAQAIAD